MGKKNLDWEKVNPGEKSTVKVNGLVNILVKDDVNWLASDFSR